MSYEQIKGLKSSTSRRSCRVHAQTFDKMLAPLRDHRKKKFKPADHRNSRLKINSC